MPLPTTIYTPFVPLFEIIRGSNTESIHYGAIAVVDAESRLVARVGDPQVVSYLRSSSKPLQALPLIEQGGVGFFDLTPAEIAIICGSHSGTPEHIATIQKLQAKIGVTEDNLQCGVHPPFHKPSAEALHQRGEEPSPIYHNCSGKHTGMLALARLHDLPIDNYLDFDHPLQQMILKTLAEMSNLESEQVALGIDGCSAPNFAIPMYNAALAYAHLCDPSGLPPSRAEACRQIVSAMTNHPDMVGGPERFDTVAMQAASGKVIINNKRRRGRVSLHRSAPRCYQTRLSGTRYRRKNRGW
ncbi:MAG: asparaginase [Chloroflexota bacterium]